MNEVGTGIREIAWSNVISVNSPI